MGKTHQSARSSEEIPLCCVAALRRRLRPRHSFLLYSRGSRLYLRPKSRPAGGWPPKRACGRSLEQPHPCGGRGTGDGGRETEDERRKLLSAALPRVSLSGPPAKTQRSGFRGERRSKGADAAFAVRRKRSLADFATELSPRRRRGEGRIEPFGGCPSVPWAGA